MGWLRSPKLATVGIALLLLGVIFAIESSGSMGLIALALGLLGLVLVIAA
jgi:hypothetical protein